MAYLSKESLQLMGFKKLGTNVLVSDKASIYNASEIELGDNTRIDDFCVVSGRVSIGRNVHVTIFCNLAGGTEGITIGDFSTIAYACHIFTQSDDYSGSSMTNSTVPVKYKCEKKQRVSIGRHCILGTNTIVFPGVCLAEGTSVGALSLVLKSTDEWSIYLGRPAKKLKSRSRDLLVLEQEYLSESAGP